MKNGPRFKGPTGKDLLAVYLDEHRMSQRLLALKAKITSGQLSHFMLGKRRPGLAVAFAIQRATAGAVPAEAWLRQAPGRRRRAKRSALAKRSAPPKGSGLADAA